MNIRDLISSAISELDAEIQGVRDSAQAQLSEAQARAHSAEMQAKHLDGAEAGVARFVEILMGKVVAIGQQVAPTDGDQPDGEAQPEAAAEVASDAQYGEP